jgi:hypothetical protein
MISAENGRLSRMIAVYDKKSKPVYIMDMIEQEALALPSKYFQPVFPAPVVNK